MDDIDGDWIRVQNASDRSNLGSNIAEVLPHVASRKQTLAPITPYLRACEPGIWHETKAMALF